MLKAARDHLSDEARRDLIEIASELDDEDLLMNLYAQLYNAGKDADDIVGKLNINVERHRDEH